MERPELMLRSLIEKRSKARRWPYIFPGLVALLFVGHAYEDGGWESAALYIALITLSVLGVVWPTVLGWGLLFFAFLAYGVEVAMTPQNGGPVHEWAIFIILGFGPAVALWAGRPWRGIGPHDTPGPTA